MTRTRQDVQCQSECRSFCKQIGYQNCESCWTIQEGKLCLNIEETWDEVGIVMSDRFGEVRIVTIPFSRILARIEKRQEPTMRAKASRKAASVRTGRFTALTHVELRPMRRQTMDHVILPSFTSPSPLAMRVSDFTSMSTTTGSRGTGVNPKRCKIQCVFHTNQASRHVKLRFCPSTAPATPMATGPAPPLPLAA